MIVDQNKTRALPGMVLLEVGDKDVVDKIGSIYISTMNENWVQNLLVKVHRLPKTQKFGKIHPRISSQIWELNDINEIREGQMVYVEYFAFAKAMAKFDNPVSNSGVSFRGKNGKMYLCAWLTDIQCDDNFNAVYGNVVLKKVDTKKEVNGLVYNEQNQDMVLCEVKSVSNNSSRYRTGEGIFKVDCEVAVGDLVYVEEQKLWQVGHSHLYPQTLYSTHFSNISMILGNG